MAGNSNLHMSRSGKQDEFYTQLTTIEEEIKHYRNYFKNKTVFCCADDPYESNFFKYFALNFNELKLKKLITTCYVKSPVITRQMTLFDINKPIATSKLNQKKAYKIEINEVKDLDNNGAINMSDVDLLLEHNNNIRTELKGDGDFRSIECLNLMEQADIIVTNPPFSLMKDFLPLLINKKKKFIILGNVNHITLAEVKPLILAEKCWLGYNSGHFWFMVPDYYEPKKTDFKIDSTGQKWRRMGNSCWFTNFDIPKRHIKLDLFKHYNEKDYVKYDNLDAIECGFTKYIPDDYYGLIGVPVTYLPYHCPEQFSIKDILTPKINGKSKYKRILIQRKDNTNNEN